MSIQKAKQFYNELSPQQKRFVDTKTMSATFPIEKWQAFLAKTVAYDTFGDKVRGKLGGGAAIFIILAIVSAVLTFTVHFTIAIGIVVFGYLGINQIQKRRLFAKRDLNNYLRSFFFPVLDVLNDKAGGETKLAAQLDFRDPSSVQKKDKYQQRGRNVTQYGQQYVMARTQLKDGIELEFVVGDTVRNISFSKKSASGKTKYKSKVKVTQSFLIKLVASKADFDVANTKIPANCFVSQDDEFITIKVKGKVRTTTASSVLSVQAFFTGVESGYKCLVDKNNKWGNTGRSERSDDEDYDDDYATTGMMIWSTHHYSHHDYDSMDHEGGAAYDFNDKDTFFDS